MADEKPNPNTGAEGTTPPADELQSPDFQFVLKALLDAYQPVLEQELKRTRNPDELRKEAAAHPPRCEDEIELANRILGKFFNEETALRAIPAEARQALGSPEQWRWCLRHLRCCLIFGWLVCRAPRTFRAYSYYLYLYWRCIREGIDRPVGNPPTEAERKDFAILVEELAAAFKPYLTDQLASVEFPAAIPGEVIAGRIDCREGLHEACEIFERLLTARAAEALLGKETFAARHGYFCRCWCICAMCLGCCLARARTIQDVLWCLVYYFRCLRRCFGPLTCNLTDPNGCVSEDANPQLGADVVAVKGTAEGAGFDHYILEWSDDGGLTYQATGFIYPPAPPGNSGPGTVAVSNGLLAYFDTTNQNPGNYEIRMTVFSNTGATVLCTIQFQLFKKDVRILGIDGYFNLDTGWADPAAKFVENVPVLCSRPASVSEVSFGGCLSVQGGAFVGGCSNTKVKSYILDYKPGFESDCNTPGWTKFWASGLFDAPAVSLRQLPDRHVHPDGELGPGLLRAQRDTAVLLVPYEVGPRFAPVPELLGQFHRQL